MKKLKLIKYSILTHIVINHEKQIENLYKQIEIVTI